MNLDEVQKLKAKVEKNIRVLQKRKKLLLEDNPDVIDIDANIKIQRSKLKEINKYVKQ